MPREPSDATVARAVAREQSPADGASITYDPPRGRHHGPWRGRDLHRDVRVALLRAFWEYPEHAETWEVLEDAAGDADPAVAAGVVRVPADRLSPEGQRRLATLLALLLRHPEPRVRLEPLEAALAGDDDERLRRLAPAALVTRAASRGWDDELRARLEAYRIDPSLLVAAAAFTLPPDP